MTRSRSTWPYIDVECRSSLRWPKRSAAVVDAVCADRLRRRVGRRLRRQHRLRRIGSAPRKAKRQSTFGRRSAPRCCCIRAEIIPASRWIGSRRGRYPRKPVSLRIRSSSAAGSFSAHRAEIDHASSTLCELGRQPHLLWSIATSFCASPCTRMKYVDAVPIPVSINDRRNRQRWRNGPTASSTACSVASRDLDEQASGSGSGD